MLDWGTSPLGSGGHFYFMDVQGIIDALRNTPLMDKLPPPSGYLSTGSTLLNLGLTGSPALGYAMGHCTLYVGDSSSGKTWWTMQALAEAARSKRFRKHKLIYDPIENGAIMDVARFFGERAASRIELPQGAPKSPGVSRTVEDFYDNLNYYLLDGPCIYVADSLDALGSEAQLEKEKQRRAVRRGTRKDKVAGDFGDGKAKAHSQGLRQYVKPLAKHGSILLLIAQTRDVLDRDSFQDKTRAGGHALTFYSSVEIWTSIARRNYKEVSGRKYEQGIVSRARIKKNRLSGKAWSVDVPIYHSYGMDELGSMVDWLLEVGHWSASSGVIDAEGLELKGKREALIHKIEEAEMENDLRAIVAEVWYGIEQACAVQRKARYQ